MRIERLDGTLSQSRGHRSALSLLLPLDVYLLKRVCSFLRAFVNDTATPFKPSGRVLAMVEETRTRNRWHVRCE